MKDVIINLDKSDDAKSFYNDSDSAVKEYYLLHQTEFDRVILRIEQDIKRLEEKNGNAQTLLRNRRDHDTITILGTRGSGKTSFMLSVINKYEKDERLCVFSPIDPTLIEEKGHIFLYIIALIKEKVEAVLDKDSCDPSSKNFARQAKWKEKLCSLAHGLPTIDGIGAELTHSDWQDSEFIMQRGLRSVSSAINLAENFEHFVTDSLEIINKKAFLLAFDDIDIDFKKGWQILETIRKYFVTHKIITIVSGDIKLFSLSIRKQYWVTFGKELLINEGVHLKKMSHFNDLATEMEGQYFQKLMKPEYRIHLSSLHKIINDPFYNQKNGFRVVLTSNSGKLEEVEPIEIVLGYNNILKAFGICNNYQTETYRSFLLKQPVRSQVRFLSALDIYLKNGDAENNAPNRENSFTDVFLSDLFEKGVDVELVKDNPSFISIETLRLLLKEKVLSETYQLQPISRDNSLNACLTTLSFLYSRHIRYHPFLIFDYMIKIAQMRNLAPVFNKAQENTADSIQVASLEGLYKYANLEHDKVITDSVGLMNAYVMGHYMGEKSGSDANIGTIISLMGLAKDNKQSVENYEDRLDVVFQKNNLSRVLAFIPASICKYLTRQGTEVIYSIHTLLGALCELLRRVEIETVSTRTENNDGTKKEGTGTDKIVHILEELSQIRTYAIPDFMRKLGALSGNDASEMNVESDADEEFNNTGDDMLSKFAGFLKSWIFSFDKPGMTLSPHLLGKIATRLFYALENIRFGEKVNSIQEFQFSCGYAFQTHIIAFMNAVLVEDIRENLPAIRKINLNNTNYSEIVFTSNMKNAMEVKGYQDNLRLSGWILSCPLLTVYLKPGDRESNYKLRQTLKEFCGGWEREVYFNNELFHDLSRVALKHKRERARAGNEIYDKIIETLKSRKASYKLFTGQGLSAVQHNYAILRAEFADIFPSTKGSYFRKFIKYLKDNRISW
jgi:hypothetical protein